jgi:hypothetical protein
MMESMIADACLLAAGVILGRALQRRADAKRAAIVPEVPQTRMTWHTDVKGHLHFKGILSASDFLDAMAAMPESDRKFVLVKHTHPANMLHALFLVFRSMPKKDSSQ